MRLIAIILASLLSATSVGAQIEKSKPPVKTGKGAKAAVQPDAGTSEKRTAAYNEFFKAQQSESEGNFVQAVESYKKVVELDPKSPEPRVALGELYFRNRNLKDAETMAREAIALSNDSIGEVEWKRAQEPEEQARCHHEVRIVSLRRPQSRAHSCSL